MNQSSSFTLAIAAGLCFGLFSTHATASAAVIKADGSSTVFPITEAVAEEFQKSESGKTRVTVGISGTGGGFKKFCRGETDFQNASRPILKKEMDDCKATGVTYIELPVAYDALTVIVNPKNTWVTQITTEDLKKIWAPEAQGKILKWNQVRPEWPDAPLKLFGAGSDSGTFDYFTEAVVGKAKASRGDYTGSEDDNVLVQGVSSDKNSMGYLPYAYFEPNSAKLKALAVDGGAKAPKKGPILPTAKNVEDGTYFPLSRPLFVYVNAKSVQAKPELMRFVEFYLKEATVLAREVKYIPLPQKAYDLSLSHLKKNKVGTVFGGEPEVGLKIEKLLKREAKL